MQLVRCLLLGLGFVTLTAVYCIEKTKQAPPPDLPSIAAIQKQLNELEPDNPIKVDGKLGPATAAKWNRLYIEQSAANAWREFEDAR